MGGKPGRETNQQKWNNSHGWVMAVDSLGGTTSPKKPRKVDLVYIYIYILNICMHIYIRILSILVFESFRKEPLNKRIHGYVLLEIEILEQVRSVWCILHEKIIPNPTLQTILDKEPHESRIFYNN